MRFAHPFWNNLNLDIGYSYANHLNDPDGEVRRLAGSDFKTPLNTPIKADRDYTVQMVRVYAEPYRNFVRLQSPTAFIELGHILKPQVKDGQKIKKGALIAYTGASNRWLHIGYLIGKVLSTAKRVDPLPQLFPPAPVPPPDPCASVKEKLANVEKLRLIDQGIIQELTKEKNALERQIEALEDIEMESGAEILRLNGELDKRRTLLTHFLTIVADILGGKGGSK